MSGSVAFGIVLIVVVAGFLLGYGVQTLIRDRRHADACVRERQRQLEASVAWRLAWRGDASPPRALFQGPRPPVSAPDGAFWTGDYGRTTYVRKGDAWVLR